MSAHRSFISTDRDATAMHGEFMAFVTDEDSLALLRDWAVRQGFPAATAQHGGPEMFANMLETSAPPQMAVVDIDGHDDPVIVIARLIHLCGPETRIVALGSANDVGLYRRILKTGAVDYLVKPLSSDSLSQAMATALKNNPAANPAASKEAKVILVMGARGGVGTSTTAVNIGWSMAHDLKMNVALLDLDLQFGTSSLALDLEPGRGLRDIVSSPHRVDALMIASSMVSESDRFSVLAAEETIEECIDIDNAAITALLKDIRGNFDVVIVELPRHLFASQKRLITTASDIVLVSELSLAGVRDTLRIRTALKNLDCNAPMTVVARTTTVRDGSINSIAFEKGAQVKIDMLIPDDPKNFAAAANSGKALGAVAKHAPATKMMQTLAAKLSGQAPAHAAKANGGLWQKWTRGRAKKKRPPNEPPT